MEVAGQIHLTASEVDFASGGVKKASQFDISQTPMQANEQDVAAFVARCGLASAGGAAEQVLLGLDPESLAAVITAFDPGGTKDGNVLGRLRGFAAAVQAK